MTPKRTRYVSFAALVAMILTVAGSTASPASAAPYKGKTKGGSTVTFKLKGSKLKGIRTIVPTICLETGGHYTSRAGGELFQPPKATLGKKVKSKALQPAAMNHAIKATKNYTVVARRKGKKIQGKFSLNYSFLVPDLYVTRIFICSGTTTFTATPR